MDDITTTSVSKGCFLVPGQGKKKTSIKASNYLNTEEIKDTLRWETSQKVWNDILSSVKELNLKLKENIFCDLVNFIEGSSAIVSDKTRKRTEIPTATLITGVNMPDHAALFQELKQKVEQFASPYVAVLQAKHCLNMKSLMRTLGDQLMAKRDDLTEEDDDLCGDEFSFMRKKSTSLTITMIEEWYNKVSQLLNLLIDNTFLYTSPKSSLKKHHEDLSDESPEALQLIAIFPYSTELSTVYPNYFGAQYNFEQTFINTVATVQMQRSPPKKQKLNQQILNRKPSIVIMCQDLEGFPQKILRDFILMASFHVETLPIVFVLGVATSWGDVSQRLLPHSAIVHLAVKEFNAPAASSHLALIIDEILLTSDHPFKLSGRCLQLLLDVFLCHDFSIKNFLHILKFCVMEHFYEKASSILCTTFIEDAIHLLLKLNKNELLVFRQLPSIKRYAATLREEEQTKFHKDHIFKETLIKFLRDLHSYHHVYFPVLRSLHSFTCSLPRSPLGKQIRELYIACSKYELRKYEGYKEAFTYLKVSSRDQMIDRLQHCVDQLQNVDDESENDFNVTKARDEINSFIKTFTDIGEAIGTPEGDSEESSDEDVSDSLQTVKYAYQLQERLRKRVTQKRIRKMTKYEKLREKSLTFLKSFYEYHLRQVQTLPLHEAFYFDSPSQVKHHLVPSPRLSIQTALSDPFHYLKIPSFETVVSGVIPSNAPDLCVAYKLHNESGNLINLYDWMTAFHTIVSTTARDDDKENDDANMEDEAEIDDVTQARFIRAVSELQLLGFIKPTKKKTDHVQRLTWSHV